MARLTATEVARHFSDILNRVAEGEEIEITRSGAPIAVLAPSRVRFVAAEQFRDLIASAPPVDARFADDLRELRDSIGAPESPWPS
jgi:prevent-host-death family protein